MSADIIRLWDRFPARDEMCIDLHTAVDVAIRDLREIRASWGSDAARQRLSECEQMLEQALAAS